MRADICIGTAQFGMSYGIANETGQPGLDDVKRIINLAAEHKIQYYDTAQSYGTSEEVLGKVFGEMLGDYEPRCISKLKPDFQLGDYEQLRQSVLGSIERLKVPALWGLLLHRHDNFRNWDSFLECVDRLKEEGLVEMFGVSVYDPADAVRFAREDGIDMIQVPFNVMDRRLIDVDFFNLIKRQGKRLYIRSIYLQGLLLMQPESIKSKGMDWSLSYLSDYHKLLVNNGLDPEKFALQAVHQLVPTATLVIGIENHQQLVANLAILDNEPLPEDLVADWWTRLPAYPEQFVNPALW